jgi:hypothetical protein
MTLYYRVNIYFVHTDVVTEEMKNEWESLDNRLKQMGEDGYQSVFFHLNQIEELRISLFKSLVEH